MKKIVKQVAGIDVGKDELVVCLGRKTDEESDLEFFASAAFSNTKSGFEKLSSWIKRMASKELPVLFVMEATGAYHEKLAYFLDSKSFEVSIVLPNKIRSYAKSLELKTKTDQTDARVITQFGLERKLSPWKKPRQIFRTIRQLTRENDQLTQTTTMVKNQLHAEESGAFPNEDSIRRMKQLIKLLTKQQAEVKTEIIAMIHGDEELNKSIRLLRTIPGVGLLTASIVLAETSGFDLICNKRQLTSYAGLDVVEKQSGTSIHGKAKISKRGNRYLRKALHMPSLTASRRNAVQKELFTRLVSRHGIKMKAMVAIQRKMLELMYIIHKTGIPFDKNYQQRENKPVYLLK
jgi:transposase